MAACAAVILAGAFSQVPKPALVPLAEAGEYVVGRSTGGWSLVAQGKVRDDGSLRCDYGILRRIVEERESPYHHIAVIEEKTLRSDDFVEVQDDVFGLNLYTAERTSSFGNRRELRFDQYVESAVRLNGEATGIAEPYTSATTYADMLHLPLVFNREIRNVLIVGGGGGVVPMTFRLSYPEVSVDVVEIDPVVVEVAQKWFGLTPDGRLRVHVQDGRMFVHNAKQKYDAIILDAYTAGGRIPFHLTTREFLETVRGHLTERGVVLMNVISAAEGPASRLFRAELKTFRTVFGAERVYVFPKILSDVMTWQPEESTNMMLVATGTGFLRRMDVGEVAGTARQLCDEGRIRIGSVAWHTGNMFTGKRMAAVRQDDVPVLTDDYAPVDLMAVSTR